MKQINILKYFGNLKTVDGRCVKEVKCRVAQAKAAFQNSKNILCNISLSIVMTVVKNYIEPNMMYRSESLKKSKLVKNYVVAAEGQEHY